jgi:hypothetical protein
MSKKQQNTQTPAARRQQLKVDVKAFLASGNRIEQVESGVSAHDPQGRGRQLRLGQPKTGQDNTRS